MQEVFASRGAKLMKLDSWGTRVLAFPIAHNRKGIYLYWRYLGGSDIVAEFERHMRLSDKVLRFYTVVIDEDVDPDARPSEVTDEHLEAVAHHTAGLDHAADPKRPALWRFIGSDLGRGEEKDDVRLQGIEHQPDGNRQDRQSDGDPDQSFAADRGAGREFCRDGTHGVAASLRRSAIDS
jgi:small subunit ribosomal protein S6